MNKKKSSSPKINLFWLLFTFALVLGSAQLLVFVKPDLFSYQPELNQDERREALQFSLYSALFEFGIRVDWISGDNYYKKVRIPRDLSIDAPYAALVSAFQALDGKLVRAESNPDRDRKIIEVAFADQSLFQVTLVQDKEISRISGKIAIVIDDFGHSLSGRVKEFLAFEYPLNISVLPGLEYSGRISQIAAERGFEVLLHMPMEPANGIDIDNDLMLLTEMDPTEIKERFRKAIRTVPDAMGVNNHMGSQATTDGPLMETMMDEVKRADLFFLDSMTSPNSKAHKVAEKKRVANIINNTFLDSIREVPFIRKQVHLLAEMASRKGYAVGIGHPYELTLQILKEEMPKLEKLGFQFVAVSQLIGENAN